MHRKLVDQGCLFKGTRMDEEEEEEEDKANAARPLKRRRFLMAGYFNSHPPPLT